MVPVALAVVGFTCSVCRSAARAVITAFTAVTLAVTRVSGFSSVTAARAAAGGTPIVAAASTLRSTLCRRCCLSRARFVAPATVTFAMTCVAAVAFVRGTATLI